MAAGSTFDMALLQTLGTSLGQVCNDSRRVKRGDVFVAYPGAARDGRDFIAAAIAAGAAGVLWESEGYEWPESLRHPNIGVRGLRAVVGEIAAHLAGHPANDLWMIGVTGTNGKTSCTHWIAQALNASQRRTAVIGTLGNGFPDSLEHAANTTPDAIALQELLSRFRAENAAAVAMEVSSHGLDQGRVHGARFDVALFTNLTRDHLDYHTDMRSYGEAKARLFDWPGLKSAVINVDDAFGRSLVARLRDRPLNVLTYGMAGGVISGHRLDLHRFGLRLEIQTPWGGGTLSSPLLGAFNAVNLLGVLGVLLASEVPLERAMAALAELRAVDGRMQTLGGNGVPSVVVDYAHTPDALEQALRALRAHMTGGKLICVFGCGGNRDAGKRPLMGAIASRLADRVVITSDNPRSEDPQAIMAQVASGAGTDCVTEVDRARAIASAIDAAGETDVVLIAGKGHERYQELAGVRYPFSDFEQAQVCLSAARRLRDAGPSAGGARS